MKKGLRGLTPTRNFSKVLEKGKSEEMKRENEKSYKISIVFIVCYKKIFYSFGGGESPPKPRILKYMLCLH